MLYFCCGPKVQITLLQRIFIPVAKVFTSAKIHDIKHVNLIALIKIICNWYAVWLLKTFWGVGYCQLHIRVGLFSTFFSDIKFGRILMFEVLFHKTPQKISDFLLQYFFQEMQMKIGIIMSFFSEFKHFCCFYLPHNCV